LFSLGYQEHRAQPRQENGLAGTDLPPDRMRHSNFTTSSAAAGIATDRGYLSFHQLVIQSRAWGSALSDLTKRCYREPPGFRQQP
jgi:hypothetical protein